MTMPRSSLSVLTPSADQLCADLLLLMVMTKVGVGAQHYVDEANLQTALLGSYKVNVRPDTTVNIDITMMPLSLNSLDITQQDMSFTAIYVMSWTDPRLVWTPATYGGIEDFVVPPEQIWTPSVVVENEIASVGKVGGSSQDNTPLRVHYTGLVKWYPLLQTTTSCDMKIYLYPFDTQTCFITITGWGFSQSEMVLVHSPSNWTYYSANGEWDLMDYWMTSGSFSDGTDEFKRLSVYFTFRRKWEFYSQNLILPIVLTSILTCCIFAVPLDSGEKMGYALTVLLSYVVFLTWVTDTLPSVSIDTSVLQVYLAIVLVLGVLATVLTTWVVHLNFRPDIYPMSPTMRLFVRRLLLPLWNFEFKKLQRKKRGNNVIQVQSTPSHNNTTRHSAAISASPFANESDLKNKDDPVKRSAIRRSDGPEDDAEGAQVTQDTPTWQEVAAMTDYLFFMLYMMVKPLLTMVVLAILYSGYN